MISGIGTDIVEIRRFENLHENFFHKYYTKHEIEYSKWKKTETIAGIFAAKEAVAKALGTGFRNFGPIDIEIVTDIPNPPRVVLHGGALEEANNKKITACYVSISHCRDYATAYAVAEVE